MIWCLLATLEGALPWYMHVLFSINESRKVCKAGPWSLLGGPTGGSWRLWRASWGLWDGSWEALGRLLEASKRHLGPKTVIARIFRRFLKKSEILGSHLGDVWTSKIIFLGFQECIEDEADFEGVLASILGRFLKARECQKWGFRIGGLHFLRISGVVR